MPGYIIQWFDDTGKVYKEVSSTQPLPVTTVGGGTGGAEQVEVTAWSAPSSTVLGKVTVTGTGGDALTTQYGSQAATNVGIVVNSRLLGLNGTSATPIKADSNGNLLVSNGSSFIPSNTGAYAPGSDNALQTASLLFAYDTSSNQYVSLQAVNNMLKVAISGSSTMTANVLSVTTAGTRVQLPNIACKEVTIIAKLTNTGSIYAGTNTVSSTVYGVEMQAKDSFTFKVNNANLIYIDSSVSGEGISYVAI